MLTKLLIAMASLATLALGFETKVIKAGESVNFNCPNISLVNGIANLREEGGPPLSQCIAADSMSCDDYANFIVSSMNKIGSIAFEITPHRSAKYTCTTNDGKVTEIQVNLEDTLTTDATTGTAQASAAYATSTMPTTAQTAAATRLATCCWMFLIPLLTILIVT